MNHSCENVLLLQTLHLLEYHIGRFCRWRQIALARGRNILQDSKPKANHLHVVVVKHSAAVLASTN
jgi:hypothetical protein